MKINLTSLPLLDLHIIPYLQIWYRPDVGHDRYHHMLVFNLGWLRRDAELRIHF